MIEKIKKYRKHILVSTLVFLYFFLALWIHPDFQLFLDKTLKKNFPAAFHPAQFVFDSFEEEHDEAGLYTLSGWVFLTGNEPIDQDIYTRSIVLSSEENNYFYSINTIERQDVQDAYDALNMNLVNTGFNSAIKIDSLPPGSYKIGFEYTSTQDNSTYYVETKWTIQHTSDELKLIKPNILDRMILSLHDSKAE